MAKQTVDDSIVLDVFELGSAKKVQPGTAGYFHWTRGEKIVFVLLWYLDAEDYLATYYPLPGHPLPQDPTPSYPPTQWILLERIPAPRGGEHLSFACGLCEKSVRKLYLPPGGNIFACRTCHALSYRSRQTRPIDHKRFRESLDKMEAALEVKEKLYQRDVLGLPVPGLPPKRGRGRPSKKDLRAQAQAERAAAAAAEPKRPRGRPKTKRTYTRREELVLTERTSEMQAYCMKCRDRQEMVDPKPVTLKNGRPALQGRCAVCGTTMTRIVKAT